MKCCSLSEVAGLLKANPRITGLLVILAMLVAMWIVFLTSVGNDYKSYLTTAPRLSLRGLLLGVPFSWLCHFDLLHLGGNSIGMVLFGGLIVVRSGGPLRFVLAAVCAELFYGFGTWLGRGACGASGIVFGLFGYTLVLGFIKVFGPPPKPGCCKAATCSAFGECCCEKFLGVWCAYKNWVCTLNTAGDLVLALLIFGVFGGILFGAFPQGNNISWEGHIYGWLGGAFYAAFIALHERKRIQEQREMAAAGSSDFVQSSTRPIMTVHTNVAGVGLNVSCTPEQLANAAGALCTATASASQQANPSSSVWPPRNQSVSQQSTGVQNVLNANVQSANNPDSFCSPLDSARAINVKVV